MRLGARGRALGLALVALAFSASADAEGKGDGDGLIRALDDELERSMERLQLGEQPQPYFIAYRVEDVLVTDVAATFGGLLVSRSDHSRFLLVELRVGSPEFDNTNFFVFPGGSSGVARSFGGRVQLPLEDDYFEVRRQAWLLTDQAYKAALDQLAQKRAALQNRQRTSELPDFSSTEPVSLFTEEPAPSLDLLAAEALVRRLSGHFRDFPTVQASEVHLQASAVETTYVDSAGTRFRRSLPLVRLTARGEGQAPDGRLLADAVAFYGRSLAELPSAGELTGAVDALGERLGAALEGTLIRRYNGPVLLEGQAAAELLVQALAPRLVGFRRPVAEDPRIEERLEQLSGGFNDKLGGRVLPRFMRLVDDPTRESYAGLPLVGGFPIDDDGVPASPTVLVERGILKTLLSGRNPSPGVLRSHGNRRGAGPAPSNLLLESEETMQPAALERELLQLVEERELEFGVVVRRIANPTLVEGRRRDGSATTGLEVVAGVVEAFKLYRDGRREPLRNFEIAGLGTTSFKDIVAASEEVTVYSVPLTAVDRIAQFTTGAELAPQALSAVVPSLLFEELTLKTPDDPVPNPPVLPHPFFDRDR